MKSRNFKVISFLFFSGLSALIYQTVWLREFRLIFGASTSATAAVLAVFMAGLGIGSIVLGRQADNKTNALEFYAKLELLIAIFSAITPLLVQGTRYIYLAIGGSFSLGWLATVVRLGLAIIVLIIPTFLMGGTLPAAARSIEIEEDNNRSILAFLYGSNTLGAVVGTLFSTFFLLEIYGNRKTLWIACLINGLIAILALNTARTIPVQNSEKIKFKEEEISSTTKEKKLPIQFVIIASSIVGFVFLLMELIWYRMLGPLLGGSTFTFGLILIAALLGIGLGGALYGLLNRNKIASIEGFALTCLLEALCIVIPYALGDRLALIALQLRPLGAMGFYGYVAGWMIITLIVVFPASLISGIQFPLLIALLGKGRANIGRHVGLTYAFNTLGAILGSIAGGFGLISTFSAIVIWRVGVIIILGLGLSSIVISFYYRFKISRLFPQLTIATISLLLLFTTGPTSAWKHSPIGAGRVDIPQATSQILEDWIRYRRRAIYWEKDGIESNVGLSTSEGIAFIINGKNDGHSRDDAGTQIMSGLIGALLHPNPKHAMVIGLGTGSTAGWLGVVPSMERVDVVELEPAVLEVAKACAPVNQNASTNPKISVSIGDAREILLTSRQKYDLIFSEPSNPYRAGIASLFTQEYYLAVNQRLENNGIFLQWLQGYEVDARTIKIAYSTLASVFSFVEIWQTQEGDLLFVSSQTPINYNVQSLRARIKEEPFKTALIDAWRITNLEGVLAHYVASNILTQSIKHQAQSLNTDDSNTLEFGFARNVGHKNGFTIQELSKAAEMRNAHRPEIQGEIDWNSVENQKVSICTMHGKMPTPELFNLETQKKHAAIQSNYLSGDFRSTLSNWKSNKLEPIDLFEITMLAEIFADEGDDEALKYIQVLQVFQNTEADALLGRLRWRQGRLVEATNALEAAFIKYRNDPWPLIGIMQRSLKVASSIASQDKDKKMTEHLFLSLKSSFCVFLQEDDRRFTLMEIAEYAKSDQYMLEAMKLFEPNVPWQGRLLLNRLNCYKNLNNPLTKKAQQDFDKFIQSESASFDNNLN